MGKHLLTANEVAEILNLKPASVYSQAREHRLPGIVKLGRLVRFDADKIEEFIASGGQALAGGWKREA